MALQFRILILLLCCGSALWAQRPAELGLITENDLYTSPKNDKYYTNGLEVFFRYMGKPAGEHIVKKIVEFRVGQYIYNPQSVQADNFYVNDRPFAGYLFAEAGINTFYKSENVLKVNFQAGVVGPASGASEFQQLIHRTFGYHTIKGWHFQITNTLGLQGSVLYSNKIFKERYKQRVGLSLQAEVNVGTIWTGISLGPMVRVSLKDLLLPTYDSALYGAALNNDSEKYKGRQELFLYFNPNINYQLYDATIQGGLFNDDSPVTFPLLPFRFNAEAGIKYRRNNWSLSYSFNYRGKELSNNVISGYYYGSISISRFL